MENETAQGMAEQELKESRLAQGRKFCPIAQVYCRSDCASFFEGKVREIEDKGITYFVVDAAQCTNVLIDGIIYVEEA